MAELSHLNNLTSAIRDVVEKEKEQILIAKPLNALKAAGDKAKSEIYNEYVQCEELIKNLNTPEDELEEKKEKLAKANRRLTRKVEALKDELEEAMRQIIRKGKTTLEDDVDSCVSKMNHIIDGSSRWRSMQKEIDQLDAEIDKLVKRTLKRSVQRIADDAKRKMIDCSTNFFTEASDIIRKYIPDVDFRSFEKKMRNQIEFEIQDGNVFNSSQEDNNEEIGFLEIVGGFLWNFCNGYTFGTLGLLTRAIDYSDNVHKLRSEVNEISNSFDPEPYLNSCLNTKDAVLASIQEKVFDEFVAPLQQQVDDILSHLDVKKTKLAEAEERLAKLKEKQKIVKDQIDQFSNI